ncbi:hypothetical protein ABZ593_21110 [Streptomyces sp. NPDC012617]|uniref:hypothetical protein n=1 Tax=Streptomyces TaxID=1883 RepID=UPI0033D160A6
MSAFGWLNGRNDRQLATTTYPLRESATARKERLEGVRVKPGKTAQAAARAGQAWEDEDRRRERRRR